MEVGPELVAGAALTDSAKLELGADVATEPAILSKENSELALPTDVAGAADVLAASEVLAADVDTLKENGEDDVSGFELGVLAASLVAVLKENPDAAGVSDFLVSSDVVDLKANPVLAGASDLGVSAADVAGLKANPELAGASDLGV